MQNITIGRYSAPEADSHGYGAWIEGVRDDGTSWIMFLNADGSPSSYFGRREPDGGVIGLAVPLS